MSEELAFTSATTLLHLYRAKQLSPVEATQAILDRIERLNPRLNAYCLVDAEQALQSARASEQRWQRGEPAGPLDGVPTSIKDIVLTKGWPTLRGSRTVDPKGPWTDDAPATARLREAGAVLLGKTTTPEFGWKGVTDSPLTGITRNPWNLERTPGGSSGGASAQVAAGLGQLAVGTDGGGSIRIPAAFAGIFGLKPSFGRVPAWPLSPFGTVAHLGPMARTVADAALMLNALAQPDARDWHALPYQATDWTAGLDGGIKGLKVAYSPTLGYAKVDAEVAALAAEAAAAFAGLGAEVEEVERIFDDPTETFWLHWLVGAYNGLGALPAEQRALLEAGLRESVEAGERVTLKQFLAAGNARGRLGQSMRLFHDRYDLLLTPALAVPAFAVGRLKPETMPGPASWPEWTPFTYPFNLSQQPAASVPCGFTRDGLPAGLQIVGPMHRDDLVLRAARAYEAAHPTTAERPPLR
ncbi:MAG TPA: amidase [Candidatus Sulfotelmatobacter sp.]|nr:amidase [Candidatus Sulfotelmatobacter sp.]